MAGPSASYSVRLRVELEDVPGMLGRLTTAIGSAGGNISALDIVEVRSSAIVRDITVFCSDEGHAERIRTSIESLEGVRVESVRDRTFLMHEGGKIEVRSKVPLQNRDDLS